MSRAGPAEERPRLGPEYWRAYAFAWSTYAVLLAIALVLESNGNNLRLVLRMCAHVSTGALLGVPLSLLCIRIPFRQVDGPFLVRHLTLGLAFTVVWTSAAAGVWGTSVELALGHAPRIPAPVKMRWQALAGVMVYLAIAGSTSTIQTVMRLRTEQTRIAQLEVLRVRAELAALRARLDPHFLFNTLHTLTALVRSDPSAAETALERFAQLLRYTLRANPADTDSDWVTIEEEWGFIRDYLSIEALRMGDRLRIETDLDPDAADVLIPAFTIQPLVENAIRHGLGPSRAGGSVRLHATATEETVEIKVSDDGVGAELPQTTGAEGVGINVIRARLASAYGDGATLDFETAKGAGFVSRLSIPIQGGAR